MPDEKSPNTAPQPHPEMTDLPPDTPLTVEGDGPASGRVAQALLARKKAPTPSRPTDCSRLHEEIAVLFIGDAAACVTMAGRKKVASGTMLFDPACGRSGNDVEVIEVQANGAEHTHGSFALACHYSSKRVAGRLQVNGVMITRQKEEGRWSREFHRSFFANCTGDDPGGA